MHEARWRRLRRVFRPTVQNEVDDEVAFHFRMRVDEFIESGLSRDAAESLARDRFGDVDAVRTGLIQITARRRRRLDLRESLDGLRHDVAIALRSLRCAPMFAAGMILILGVGIGANAMMFGVIDRLFLRGPAHVRDAAHVERLFFAMHEGARGKWNAPIASYAAFASIRDHSRFIQSAGAFAYAGRLLFGHGATARRVPIGSATWDYFTTLGVHPALGRFFTAAEDHAPHGERVMVLSSAFWKSELGADSSIIGRPLTFGGDSFVVVGVAPDGFVGLDDSNLAAWIPVSVDSQTDDWASTYQTSWLRIVVRLRDGATIERAEAEATANFRARYAGTDASLRTADVVLRPLWYGDNGAPTPAANISVLLGGVALAMLLIVCANTANLLLARTLGRRQEIAVRVALGIGTARLLRLVGVEAAVLSIGGAIVGMFAASAGDQLMRATLLRDLSLTGSVVNVRVLIFTALSAGLVCLVLALASAAYATRVSVGSTLRSGVREGGGRRGGVRHTLFVVQAALCVMLLTAAGLFVQSLVNVRSINLGFDPTGMLSVYTTFSYAGVDEYSATGIARATQATVELRDQLARHPSIERVAVAIGGPYSTEFSVSLFVPDRESFPQVAGGGPYVSAVSPDFFSAMGTRLERGRLFDTGDTPSGDRVVIVSETLANAVWPDRVPIGQCLLIRERKTSCAIVVGVVSDSHRHRLREAPAMQYYVPLGQARGIVDGAHLIVRLRGDRSASEAAIRRIAATLPGFVSVDITPVAQYVDGEVRPWRVGAILFGAFGVLALIVASAGLYSVVAYLVADRTHEMGVRMALGASGSQLIRQIVGGGARLAAIGIAVGISAVLLGGRLIEPLLFDASSRDPKLLVGVALSLLAVAAVAAYFPARRAASIDPVRALRAD